MARNDDLYRLALAAAGQGQADRACESFVTALFGIRHVASCAVWVRRELLTIDRPGIETGGERTLVRLCSAPPEEDLPEAVPASLPIFGRITRSEGALVSLPDPEAAALVGEAAGRRGRLLLMRLLGLGYMAFRSDSMQHPLASLRLDGFLEVLEVFRGTLQAHFLRRELHREETLRKRQAARIERQEEGFRHLIDRLVDIVVVVDFDTKIRFANAATERYLGYPPEELGGKSILELVPGEDVKSILDTFRRCVSGGEEGETLRLRAYHADGQIRELDCIVHQALAGVGMTGLVMSCHDITEVEAARRTAESASRARERFLAMMSHEVRTPMNGVLGMANLLEHTRLDGEQRDLVQTIRSSAESLLTVINEVLDFSRIESGMVEVERVVFEPVRLVEETAAVVAPLALDKGVRVDLRIAPDVPARWTNDPVRFRQVLLNLLSNAAKFTEAGSIGVDLERAESSSGSPELRLRVTDTGIGIDGDRLETLFDPYVQADTSVARRFGGTGLGLSISKELCGLMGGGISVESAPGKGSVFSFWIGGHSVDDVPWWTERSFTGLQGRHVLLVVAEESLCARLGFWLESWGAATTTTSSPTEARELVSLSEGPDVAVIDGLAPGLEGSGLLEALDASGAPALLLAAGPGGGAVPASGIGGRVETLTPPLGPYRLHNWLSRLLEGEEAPAVSPAAPLEDEGGGTAPGRVLVADDNPVNRKVAALMLRQMGYRVAEAADGEEALRRLENEHFDLVLMDVHMPRMDGLEACRRIRADGRYGNPRILAMTALTLRHDIQRCRDAGMDGYVSKPLEMGELQSALRRGGDGSFCDPGKKRQAAAEETPVIDEARLEVLRRVGGDRLIANMARLFMDHARKNMDALKSAMDISDWKGVREAAHGLKGSSLNLGLTRLGGVARRLEELAGRESAAFSEAERQEMVSLSASVSDELEAAFEAIRVRQHGPG